MSAVPNAVASPPAPRPFLPEARAAFDRGDDAAAIARAEAFIAASPGDPLLADAQLLLARSRERTGDWAAAWEQYRLFLSNFPTHAAAREALARAADLARRHVFSPAQPVFRWRIVSADEPAVRFDRWSANQRDGPTGAILALGRRPDWETVARLVDHAAVEGVRLLLWPPLDEPEAPFDPFDDVRVRASEDAYRAAARLPVDGFLVGPALSLGAGARGLAAQRVMESLSQGMLTRSETSGRFAWAWAGLRARASARALGRFVQTVERVQPGRMWFAAVSAVAVVHPTAAILQEGEDLAELHRAVPRLVPVLIGVDAADREAIGVGISRVGFSAPAFGWTSDRELVALP
ncbi:MAG: hypothetical protein HY207_10805 [Nitrospirae bacterium]|nr:hypothetical protein [Nitrospirota bacterium]